MNPEQRRLIKSNLDIFLRHKKLIIFFLLLAIAGGLAYYLKLPKIYQGTALIMYQRQTVNPTVMSPDDHRTQTRDVINSVRQQITSRSSLEEIIREYDLYSQMRKTMPMEKVVEMMRKFNIQTRMLQGGDVFEVSFQGLEQQKVMEVTNALAQRFIEENTRFRRAQASQTSTYIQDELRGAKKALDEKEETMRDYKLSYYNEMPEQLPHNTARLNNLQEQLQNLQTSQLELEQTRLMVQEQIANRNEIIARQAAEAASTPAAIADQVNSIEQIRARLENLQPRYTDKHPEVRRLKKLLKNLEQNQSEEGLVAGSESQDPTLRDLEQQLKDIDFNIKRLQNERQQVSRQIAKIEKWIAAAPIREAEWAALTRDYEQLNEYYQRLVTQNLQADSAISLERQLGGSQFKIIDEAHYPEKPLEPDFKKIFLLVAALGLGLGGALSYGIELTSTSFKDPVELEKYLDIPVVCALPQVLTKQERIKRKATNITTTIFLVLMGAAVIGAIYSFWEQGMIII